MNDTPLWGSVYTTNVLSEHPLYEYGISSNPTSLGDERLGLLAGGLDGEGDEVLPVVTFPYSSSEITDNTATLLQSSTHSHPPTHPPTDSSAPHGERGALSVLLGFGDDVEASSPSGPFAAPFSLEVADAISDDVSGDAAATLTAY